MITALREQPPPRVAPRVSVVVPVLDGGAAFARQLVALAGQRLRGGHELLIVDSGSRDGSLQRALDTPARVFVTSRLEFGHGATRNAGIDRAHAPLVVLLSQDAIPRGERFLARLIRPLERDPAFAGAYARQVPPAGADPLVVAALASWTPSGEDRRQRALDAAALRALSPAERVARCRFDDVASCVRRSVWRRWPLPDVPFGEDVLWARDVLLAGHDLLYRAAAAVTHAHQQGPRQAFERDRRAHALLAAGFGLRTVPGPAHALRGWLAGWLGDARTLRAAGLGGGALGRGLVRGALRRGGAVSGQLVGGWMGSADHRPWIGNTSRLR